MTNDEGLDNAAPGQRPTEGSVELRVIVEPGKHFAGSIRFAGRSTELPFSGWIEFMSLINAMRDGEDDLP